MNLHRGDHSIRSLLAVTAMVMAGPVFAEGSTPLQPYQMVRSLQLVQDRIASGDHAALPMQRKLLEMIDKRFRNSEKEDFADKRNFRAMLVYAMSGGNPVTIEVAMSRVDTSDDDAALGAGILAYLRGDVKSARADLSSIEPLKLSPELGAFLALVKGSVIAGESPTAALKLLDQARLLGAGTLVEEAALRRSIALSVKTGDSKRFMVACGQYVRRFLRSPYASQFADAFVSGVVALHGKIDFPAIDDVTADMAPEQRKVIYLRLARLGAIDGIKDLSEYASARVGTEKTPGEAGDDPRALLYSSLAAVTSDTVNDVLAKLKTIDRTKLSKNDLQLLDAAQAVATEMVAVPVEAIKPDAEPAAIAETTPKPTNDDAAVVYDGDLPVPDLDPQQDAVAPESVNLADKPASQEPAAQPKDTTTVKDTASDPAEKLVIEARKKLEAIDQLLGSTAQ